MLLNPLIDLGVNFDWEVFYRIELALLPTKLPGRVRGRNKRGQETSVHRSKRLNRPIVVALDCDLPPEPRKYAPIREFTGLFKTFAALQCSEDAVLGFARRFGLLGCRMVELDAGVKRSQSGRKYPSGHVQAKFEFLDDWYNEIVLMRWLVTSWESPITGEGSHAGTVIKVADDGKSIDYRFRLKDRVGGCQSRVIFGRILEDDLPDFRSILRAGSKGHRTVVLWHVVSERLNLNTSQVRLLPAGEGGRLTATLSLCPSTLIDALWMQFASALSRHPRFRDCSRCGGFFEVRSKSNKWGKRQDAKYCSDNCRVRASEERERGK